MSRKVHSSVTRQWHWNAAFSRTVTYINPEKKPPPQFMVVVVRGGRFPNRTLDFLVCQCMSSLQRLHKQATNRSVFPTGMFEDGLLVGDQLPRHSTASLTCQVVPAAYASISCPGWRGGAHLSHPGAPGWEHSLEKAMTSSIIHPAWLPSSSQPVPQSWVKQSIGPEWLQSCSAKPPQWARHCGCHIPTPGWAPRWISILVTPCRTIKEFTKPV